MQIEASTGGASSSKDILAGLWTSLQISIILIWQRHSCSILHFLLVLVKRGLVDRNLWWCQSWSSNEFEGAVSNQLASQPQERLLEVVVGFRRDVVVLEVLLSVECDRLSLDLALLYVDLVSAQYNWNVFANSNDITCTPLAYFNLFLIFKLTMPVWNVLVCDSGGDVEHDDGALAVDVVAISQTAELLLSCGIPDIELNLAQVLCTS